MGKASSAKKVHRAARAGSTARASERRPIGFPALVIATMLLGVGLVVFARSTRDAVASPTLSDHWHSAYSFYDCTIDAELPPVDDVGPDVLGIHTHGDGLIHVHPFSAQATGKGATLGLWLDQVSIDVNEDAITFADGSQLVAGTECDGEPAVIQVLRWSDALSADSTDPEVILSDHEDTRFLSNIEAFVFALAPVGASIPPPSSIPAISQVTDVLAPTPGAEN